MRVLRIVNWNENFENNRSREIKNLSWVMLPNSHDGDGYTELLDHEDGPEHFGAWCAIAQVASKCEPRGTLLRDGFRAHDFSSLARMTRFPRETMHRAIGRLLEIGWLEEVDVERQENCGNMKENGISHEGATIPHKGATSPQETALEQNRTELNRNNSGAGAAAGKNLDLQEADETVTRILSSVQRTDLQSVPDLMAICDALVAANPKKFKAGEPLQLRIVQTADASLSKADKPAAFFHAIVKARNWGAVDAEYRLSGEKRFDEWKSTNLKESTNGHSAGSATKTE